MQNNLAILSYANDWKTKQVKSKANTPKYTRPAKLSTFATFYPKTVSMMAEKIQNTVEAPQAVEAPVAPTPVAPIPPVQPEMTVPPVAPQPPIAPTPEPAPQIPVPEPAVAPRVFPTVEKINEKLARLNFTSYDGNELPSAQNQTLKSKTLGAKKLKVNEEQVEDNIRHVRIVASVPFEKVQQETVEEPQQEELPPQEEIAEPVNIEPPVEETGVKPSQTFDFEQKLNLSDIEDSEVDTPIESEENELNQPSNVVNIDDYLTKENANKPDNFKSDLDRILKYREDAKDLQDSIETQRGVLESLKQRRDELQKRKTDELERLRKEKEDYTQQLNDLLAEINKVTEEVQASEAYFAESGESYGRTL